MNQTKFKNLIAKVIREDAREEAWCTLMLAPKQFRKDFILYAKADKGNLCCLTIDTAKKHLIDTGIINKKPNDAFGNDNFIDAFMTLDDLKDKAAKFSDETFGKNNEKRIIPVSRKFLDETHELLEAIAGNESKNKVDDEFADVFALFLDMYRMYHGNDVDMQTLINITSNKLDICKTRTWSEPNEQGVQRHIK